MTVSISAWADRIGIQNRKIAAAHKGRQEAYDQMDAADQELQKIQAKYTDGGDGDADGKPKEPSAEDIKAMGELENKIVAGKKAVMAADEAIAKEEAILADCKQQLESRERHNRTEERLNSSAGRSGDGEGYRSPAGSNSNVTVLPPTNEQLDHDLACMVRCIAIAGSNVQNIPTIARERFSNDRVAATMQANIFSSGGALVPDQYMPRLIQALYATSVVRAMGIPEIPIEFGSLSMPRITTGAIAAYTGEGQNIDETSVGTDRVTLIPKELGGLLPMSNMLLAQSSPSADTVMMQQLSIGMSLAEDRGMLRGPKSGAGPTGLRFLAQPANIIAASSVSATIPTVAEVELMAGLLELALENNNVPGLSLFWIMAPRTKKFLMNLRDGNGNRIYPELVGDTPTWRGVRVLTTTNVPINLSPGTASEIMLVDASQQMIGQNPRINIAASTETAYQDAGGNWVSAFQRNETVMRMIVYNDIATQHPESIAVLTGVRWGAAS